MISVGATLTKLLLRVLVKRRQKGMLDVAESRRSIDSNTSRNTMPPGVKIHDAVEGGVSGEWIVPEGAEESGSLLAYFHGGAYHCGSPVTHRSMVARIALAAGRRAFVADYRLAPEHPYPAQVDDALSVYESLSKQNLPIALVGDSAGGGLILALTHRLKLVRKSLPEAVICLSPWANLETTQVDPKLARRDPMLTQDYLLQSASLYAGETLRSHPEISPVNADFKGFPPLLIQVGTHEILLPDSLLLESRARQAGAEVTLQTWPGMFHVWQMFAERVPEGRRAINRIGRYLHEIDQV